MLPNFNKDFTQPSSGENFGSFGAGIQGKNPKNDGRNLTNLNLSIAVFILTISALAYAGLFGYSFYLDRVLNTKTIDLASQKESFGLDIINNIIQFSTVSEALNVVFENRIPAISFLDEFASVVVPTVQFTSLSLSRGIDNIFNISVVGKSPDLRRYLQQLNAFRQNDVFKSGLTTSFNVSGGEVSFTYTLNSKLELLEKGGDRLNSVENNSILDFIPSEELVELEEEEVIEESIDEEGKEVIEEDLNTELNNDI